MDSLMVLLGPPEIHDLSEECLGGNTAAAGSKTDQTAVDPFMNLLTSQFNKTKLKAVSQTRTAGLTENFSPTFLSSGNPCLDFFFHVVPDTPSERLIQLLESAWVHDPTTTLKLVCQLRGVREKGKSDKEGFYTAALWLHGHHPKTLAGNIRGLSAAGYLKDLPEILFRLLKGPDVRRIAKQERIKRPFRKRILLRRKRKSLRINRKAKPREQRIDEEKERCRLEKEHAAELRRKKTANMALKAIARYNNDQDFRFLYDEIAKLFAELLASDLAIVGSGRKNPHLSLAAKWCPSLNSSYDRSLLLCEAVGKRLFPRESHPEYADVEERHYSYRVRDRLRKQALVPLRRIMQLPEVYMSANQWDALPYNRVASVAMKNYKRLFQKHDGDRFAEYLRDVKMGKCKIASGALLPHEILKAAITAATNGGTDEVAELQWRGIVEEMQKKQKLTNSLAICDVSGSMAGTPIEVSIALGLLVSELSSKPWNGHLLTFSENPQLHEIEGGTLAEKYQFVENMQWGMNTDFQKVFDLILKIAVDGTLTQDQMIKRVFVFSDMEFDEASANPWETDYMAIVRKFRKCGYEKPPEIVFWNLRDSIATPVQDTEKGVALVSGFSKNLLKIFMENSGEISPVDIMEAAISGKEYEMLAVID
ncbi:uncharacterized protein LOC116257269 [Nymphaea colorata]|uniref:TROVE domain-containing protein n=1 Tax=Nymphaea colorata TaxID=210225 RepID=A0A5K1F7P2_9MAGN|nr:uncharacterized protein LOC116257269 [Nymphaea colorata]VVW59328.1 unnamed protein product [Nymphaea colorata]